MHRPPPHLTVLSSLAFGEAGTGCLQPGGRQQESDITAKFRQGRLSPELVQRLLFLPAKKCSFSGYPGKQEDAPAPPSWASLLLHRLAELAPVHFTLHKEMHKTKGKGNDQKDSNMRNDFRK